MEEHIAQEQLSIAIIKRLREILGNGYTIKKVYHEEVCISKIETIEEKDFWGRTHRRTKQIEVAYIDDLCPNTRRWIKVYDRGVYAKMKEFGEEFGFENLLRAWPGAAENMQKTVDRTERKPIKIVTETLDARYEQIKKKR